MSSISQKKNAYKVQIRRKRVQDKIAQLRATYMQEHLQSNDEQYSDTQIAKLVDQTISSKEKVIQNIALVKAASFHVNEKNAQLFFPLIQQYCYILGNLDELKQTPKSQTRDSLYNDITTTLINISSNQAYQWPTGEYLPIIKNLLKRQRQVNTMWLLSNILYQRQNPATQSSLTRQLVKYDCITFCTQRLDTKFQNQQDMNVFVCFVSSFLTNAEQLTLQELKRIIRVLESLAGLGLESIDWFIVESMVDHAPCVGRMNYELLHSQLMTSLRQRYIKKKKTRMVLKYLQFVKTFIFTEIQQSINPQTKQFKDIKIARNNYQRISIIILPVLTLCLENLSPQVKSNLMEICCMLLEYYFAFVDLEHQGIYLQLAEGLGKNAGSVLSKYSSKALYWQLRVVHILFDKIQEYKISTQIISQFMNENNILEAFSIILKDKVDVVEIVQEVVELMGLVLGQVGKEEMVDKEGSKNQYYLHSIKQTLQLMLANHLVGSYELHKKVQQLILLCEHKG